MKWLILVFVLIQATLPIKATEFTYPNGAKKAVIFSYDDGMIQDRKLVKLMNKYNVVGTFNLNSGLFASKAPWLKDFTGKTGEYIAYNEVQSLYAGHEIAGHSYSHPGLAGINSEELGKQIALDKKILLPLSEDKLTSFAYPLGSYDKTVMAALAKAQFSNARTTIDTNTYSLPTDFMVWHPTVHHTRAMPLIKRYIKLQPDNLTVMVVWGHSWEFDKNMPNNSWQYAESLLKTIANKEDIWYVSAGEFVEFITRQKTDK